MNLSERIKLLRLQQNDSQLQLSKKINASVSSIRGWETGQRIPSASAIISLSKAFNVSSDYLLGIDRDFLNTKKDNTVLSHDETTLLSRYRALDMYGRNVVRTVCRLEKQRVDSKPAHETPKEVSFNKNRERNKYIPLYTTPSAAGFSAPLDGDEYEMIPMDKDVPSEADFAVRIQGDSMFPYISDGDIVYVKRDNELSIGDVGIFSIDGAMYCKQYYVDSKGNLTLVSANPECSSTNVYIDAESSSSVRFYGKVILKERIGLPDYFLDIIRSDI